MSCRLVSDGNDLRLLLPAYAIQHELKATGGAVSVSTGAHRYEMQKRLDSVQASNEKSCSVTATTTTC